jgi:hypothetical protein
VTTPNYGDNEIICDSRAILPLQIDATARYDKVGKFCGVILICRDFSSDLLSKLIQTINSSLKLDEVIDNIIAVVVDYLIMLLNCLF